MNREVYSYLLQTYGRRPAYWVGVTAGIIQTLLLRVVSVILLARIAGDVATGNFHSAKINILLQLIVALSGLGFRLIKEVVSVKVENKVYASLMVAYYKKLIGKDMSFYRDHQTGYLASTFRQHIDSTIELVLLGGIGRMLGSMVLYVLADKAEDWLLGNGRRFFGFSHKQMERLGTRFSGRPRDFTVLFLLNAVPVLPTALLSLTCGFVKINFRMFVVATFLGATVNAIFYMGIGYAGLQAAEQLRNLELTFQIAAAVIAIALLGWYLYYRTKKRGL